MIVVRNKLSIGCVFIEKHTKVEESLLQLINAN